MLVSEQVQCRLCLHQLDSATAHYPILQGMFFSLQLKNKCFSKKDRFIILLNKQKKQKNK